MNPALFLLSMGLTQKSGAATLFEADFVATNGALLLPSSLFSGTTGSAGPARTVQVYTSLADATTANRTWEQVAANEPAITGARRVTGLSGGTAGDPYDTDGVYVSATVAYSPRQTNGGSYIPGFNGTTSSLGDEGLTPLPASTNIFAQSDRSTWADKANSPIYAATYSTRYIFWCDVKAGTRNDLDFTTGYTNNGAGGTIDLATEIITPYTWGVAIVHNSGKVDLANGLTRYWFDVSQFTDNSGETNAQVYVWSQAGASNNLTEFDIQHVQVETYSEATERIITSGSSVARNADVVATSGASLPGSWNYSLTHEDGTATGTGSAADADLVALLSAAGKKTVKRLTITA